MPSVTKRIEKIYQPIGGYVPTKLFKEKQYIDTNDVVEAPAAYKAIQGLVVDYLTRFMLTKDKMASFNISINGARRVDSVFENDKEIRNVMGLLDKVTGLDDTSIYSACRIVGYDVAFRRGVNWFRPVNEIIPPKELIRNIRVMVNRCLGFFDDLGPIVTAGFTFEGGYTELIGSGDGDYLTKDTLIDFKVSIKKPSIKWSLQLLIYYLMGLHSIHNEFSSIKNLCIYNPYENKSYTVKLNDIDDKSKYEVSNKVIGYKMEVPPRRFDDKTKKTVEDYSTWQKIDGQDERVIEQVHRYNSVNTGFSVDSYNDGIYDISTDDYWTYYRRYYKLGQRPQLRRTESIKFIKRNGFIMFISVSEKGVLGVLNGAAVKKATHPISYYYENIVKYARTVCSLFAGYWDKLYEISEHINALTPNEAFLRKEGYSQYLKRFESMKKLLNLVSMHNNPMSFDEWYNKYGRDFSPSGTVHGCIVDISATSHLYLNPLDGKLVSYSASSKYSKNVYKNVLSLIAHECPYLLESFMGENESEVPEYSLSVFSGDVSNMLLKPGDEISSETANENSIAMYDISNRLLSLQSIFTHNLVKVWYDDVLEKFGDKITKEEFLALIETENDE